MPTSPRAHGGGAAAVAAAAVGDDESMMTRRRKRVQGGCIKGRGNRQNEMNRNGALKSDFLERYREPCDTTGTQGKTFLGLGPSVGCYRCYVGQPGNKGRDEVGETKKVFKGE
jgi:hypothetical protein